MHLDVVRSKLLKEIAGPFPDAPFKNFRVSPLGIVPKKESNAFRLIHHLSYPYGLSLNDDIDPSFCSVHYASFDDAINIIRVVGGSALLARVDVKSAFRLLPIHPSAFNSLGFRFEEEFYFDRCLPMGCSLSCHYFELFSSFLDWVVRQKTGLDLVLHYLDDFLFVGKDGTHDCLFHRVSHPLQGIWCSFG